MSTGYQYTQGDILVEPYVFTKILDLKIERKMNEHSKLVISGIISDENCDKYVEQADDNESIKVSVRDEENNVTDLFQGIVTNISIDFYNDVRTLEVEALSRTFLMDIEKKSRSFQGDSLTYAEIFSTVNSAYSNIQISDNVSSGTVIDKLITQYRETDWEFMKRLASHFNVAIIPECRLSGIKYSIGREGASQSCTLDEFNYSINKGLKEYKLKSSNSDYDLSDMNLISYEVKTNKILDLYNTIGFKDRYLNIYECEMSIVNRVLLNKYILRDEKGMMVKRIHNDKILGVSLEGKILGCTKDMVKISLKIDGYGSNGSPVWIPYSTVFSSSDGTGWYCMPEIGDAIRLYFPDNEEKNAYAISSIHEESSNSQKRSDPSVKSLGTKYGKEIVMKPGGIDVLASGCSMSLSDGGGIEIHSNSEISMSGTSINISGDEVTVNGSSGVTLSQSGASIVIKDDVVMSGVKINTQ